MVAFLTTVALGILAGAVVAAIFDLAAPIARWIVGFAVSRLSDEDKARYREEWLADIAERDSAILKSIAALGFVQASFRLARRSKHGHRVKLEKVDMSNATVEELASLHMVLMLADDLALDRGSRFTLETAGKRARELGYKSLVELGFMHTGMLD